jgi:RNA polymerase sigma factor (sigma-70 family)
MSRGPVLGVNREVAVNDELEKQLLQRARDGDPSAGPFLVSYLGEHLLGYARSIAPDRSDVEREQIVELAVEAGVRAIDRFDPERGSLRHWFRRQVWWRTSEWRRSGPPPTAPLPLDPVPPLEEHRPLPKEVAEAVRTAIAELGAEDRLVLALRLAEGVGHAEIAQRLDISNDASRQRYARALKRLRPVMAQIPAIATYLEDRGVTL